MGNLYLANKTGPGNTPGSGSGPATEFTADDQSLAAMFAAQAAVAIENARLFEEESRRSAQLVVLNQVDRELNLVLDLDLLLSKVSDVLREQFGYPQAWVFWVDSTNEASVQRTAANQEAPETPLTPRLAQPALSPDQTGETANSQLSVLVMVKGDMGESIYVVIKQPRSFDDNDLKTTQTVADQLAASIENILPYHQRQEQSRKLAVADERDRIGRDLHYGVFQSIYAVGLTLEDIAAQTADQPAQVAPRIDDIVDDLNQVIGDIRSYIMDLRPMDLQGRRLDEALDSLVEYLEDRTGVSVTMDIQLDLAELPEQYVVNLWHIFQEAFSNIEKYARASRAPVSTVVSQGKLDLEISDNGAGFNQEEAELGRGFGLADIKDRADRLGSILVIETSPGAGTRLHVSVAMGDNPG